MGQKLEKKVTNGSTIITTDYQGGFQYEDEVLRFFATSEGYVSYDEQSEAFTYIYNYTDHLGNIRLSYKAGDRTEDPPAIVDENHYYPFGLKHKKYGSTDKDFVEIEDGDGYYVGIEIVPPGVRKTYQYKYNGKEFQDELGLNFYDYGARNYDPAIGRWMNIDNMAEKYFSITPYNYAANIPTRFVDYDGNDFGISFKNGAITITQTWYHDGKETTKDLLDRAVEYINSNSGKYGLQTKKGDIIPINFEIKISNKEDELYDDGFINNHSKNQDLARRDGTANYLSLAGMEIVNSYNANGLAWEGGDDTRYYYDDNDKRGRNANSGTIVHEIMHTLGMTHTAIGKNGTKMTKDGVGGMLLYASKNGRKVNIKLSNIIQDAYLGSSGERVPNRDKPSVINTDSKKIKLSGTIVEIK